MVLRADTILQAASARAARYLEDLPARRGPKYRQNCQHISAICSSMLSLRPPRAPTCAAISEEGSIKFLRFPSEQTLHNSYRELVEIWREAYRELNNMGAVRSRLGVTEVNFIRSELAPLDTTTRDNVILLQVLYKEACRRENDLRQFISENIPYRDPGAETIMRSGDLPLAPDLRAELAAWLARLDSGSSGFDVDDLGVRITRRIKPGDLILSRRMVDALKAIAQAK